MALSHINGHALDNDALGWRVLHDGSDEAGSAVDGMPVSLRHSQGFVNAASWPRHEGRPFGLSVRVRDDNEADARLSAETLRAIFRAPTLTGRRSGDGHLAGMVLSSLTTERVTCDFFRVNAVLTIPGVFFRDETPVTQAVSAGASSHTSLAGSAPITDAVVRFGPGPLSGTPELTDAATGTGISVDWTLSSGYLYIDCGTLQAWSTTDAAAWSPTGTDRSHLVNYPPAGPLQLWPVLSAGGVRQVHVDASHAVTVRARRAWL